MNRKALKDRIAELEKLVATPITNGMMYALELAKLRDQYDNYCTACGANHNAVECLRIALKGAK